MKNFLFGRKKIKTEQDAKKKCIPDKQTEDSPDIGVVLVVVVVVVISAVQLNALQ